MSEVGNKNGTWLALTGLVENATVEFHERGNDGPWEVKVGTGILGRETRRHLKKASKAEAS